ncbi:MAG: hypothetical protein H7222_08755 [Methylotenera sp.]|nr:hypothetical protein [Oligoflexia bacterium]
MIFPRFFFVTGSAFMIFSALVLVLWPNVTFATDGINLLASSARGQARAGATTAVQSSPSDSFLGNPSLIHIASENETELEVSVSGLFLDVSSKNSQAVPFGGTGQSLASDKKFVLIPTLGVVHAFSERLSIGTGMVAEAGLASDHRGRTELLELKPELSVAKVPVAISYATSFGNLGAAPMLGLARYSTNSSQKIGSPSQSDRPLKTALGFGISLGASREFGTHSVGLGWKSKSKFRLKEFADLDAYGPFSNPDLDTLELESPSQWNIGYAYRGLEDWIFFLDLKRVEWANAKAFKEFGWKNQWVAALALERTLGRFSARCGFNLSTPVYRSETARVATGVTDIQGHSVYQSNLDFFNVVGYPAILTRTATVGGSFEWGEADARKSAIDLALLHSFKETISRSGTGAFGLPYSYETEIQFTNVVASYRTRF